MPKYYGVKNCVWLQALTLLHFLPIEDQLRYDCIKAKTIKSYSNLFSCSLFKNT